MIRNILSMLYIKFYSYHYIFLFVKYNIMSIINIIKGFKLKKYFLSILFYRIVNILYILLYSITNIKYNNSSIKFIFLFNCKV